MLVKIPIAAVAMVVLMALPSAGVGGDLSYRKLATRAQKRPHLFPAHQDKTASQGEKLAVHTQAEPEELQTPPTGDILNEIPLPVPEDGIYVDDQGVHLYDEYLGDNYGTGGCDYPERGWHRTGFFGEFLYLRARDAEVAFAEEVDGPAAPPPNQGIQVGPIAVVDPDYEPAFRVGFSKCLDTESSIQMKYAHFESDTSNSISRTGTNVIRGLLIHPLVPDNAAGDWLDASANLAVDFDLIDLDYRWIYCSGDNYVVNLLLGARYGRLEQNLAAQYSGAGSRTVVTDIDFDGVGIRLGADFERYAQCSGWMVYGRTEASFLAGEFRGDIFQGGAFDPVEVDTSWRAGRIVPMLDLELGVGWENKCGSLRFTAGYLISAWFNTVQTDEYIRAVGVSRFDDLSSTTTFDGLTARAEYRF